MSWQATCPRCRKKTLPTAAFCPRCGMALRTVPVATFATPALPPIPAIAPPRIAAPMRRLSQPKCKTGSRGALWVAVAVGVAAANGYFNFHHLDRPKPQVILPSYTSPAPFTPPPHFYMPQTYQPPATILPPTLPAQPVRVQVPNTPTWIPRPITPRAERYRYNGTPVHSSDSASR